MNKSLNAELVNVCTSRGDPLFHSCCDGIISGKILSTHFIFHKPKQMEVRRCEIQIYSGCGRTVQPRLAVCSTVFKQVRGMVLSCCKRKAVFFSGLILEIRAISLVSVTVQWSELMASPGFKKSRRITPFLFQKPVYITLLSKGFIWNFFIGCGIHVTTPQNAVLTLACSGAIMSQRKWFDPWNCQLHPCIHSIGPDKLVHSVLSVPLWEFMDPSVANFVIFQHCYYCLQHWSWYSALYTVPWT